MNNNTEQLAVIDKIDKHPGGPITLTQEECWHVATILERINTLADRRLRMIANALEKLEPQSKRVTPSIIAVREVVQILKGR